VVVSQPGQNTFFAKILGTSTFSTSARAVAGPSDSTGCIYALNTADPVYTTELNISSTVNVPNCSIVSNGNFAVASGSSVTAKSIAVTASSGSVSGTVTPAPVYNVAASTDPFAGLNEASLFGSLGKTCSWRYTWQPTAGGASTVVTGTGVVNLTTSGRNYTLDPGVYCGDGSTAAIKIGLKLNSANPPGTCVAGSDDIVTFKPGVYIINGGLFDWKHSCVVGTGVTFYFTGTTTTHDYPACGASLFSTDAPDRFYLTAPTSGTYEGLLFIQDRTQATGCTSNPVKVNILPSNMALDGVMYFPNHHVAYGATTTVTGNYSVIVAGTIAFANKATFSSNYTGLAGGSPVKAPALGE
jgi:hypothetical protein